MEEEKLNLTEKEIGGIGWSRYMEQKWKKCLLLFLLFATLMIVLLRLDEPYSFLAFIPFGFFAYGYVWLFFIKMRRLDKEFRERFKHYVGR